MIIKRRFETVGVLVDRDPKSKEIFYEELGKYIPDRERIDELIRLNYHIFIYRADMG